MSDVSTNVDVRNRLNELTGKEWIQETKSFFYQRGLGSNSSETKFEKMHPAPFSFTDVSKLLKFFTKRGNKVLDPFLGVGSTTKACIDLERDGYGIELNEKWYQLSKQRILEECDFQLDDDHIICDDSANLLNHFSPNTFDFIITSPPYWNILNKDKDYKGKERISNGYDHNYGNSELDLGNIDDYQDFLKAVTDIFFKCYDVLKKDKYMCIIVSDFRHKSEFIPYHSDLIRLLTQKKRGKRFSLQGIKVLIQNAKKLYPYGYPYSYVENIHHQYVLILRKSK